MIRINQIIKFLDLLEDNQFYLYSIFDVEDRYDLDDGELLSLIMSNLELTKKSRGGVSYSYKLD